MMLTRHSSIFLTPLVYLCLALLSSGPAIGQTIVSTATADGDVQTWAGDDVDTNDNILLTQQSGGLQRNIIMEFDLGMIPSAATINSASLEVVKFGSMANTGGNPVPLELYGYLGDGVVDISDYAAPGTAIGTYSEVLGASNGDVFNWALSDVSSLQNAVAGLGLAAIRIETNNFGSLSLASLENTSGYNAPQLSIAYSIPEPNSIALLILGSMICVSKRRRCG